MVIERELKELCNITIKLLKELEEKGLLTKAELERHLEPKLKFLEYLKVKEVIF